MHNPSHATTPDTNVTRAQPFYRRTLSKRNVSSFSKRGFRRTKRWRSVGNFSSVPSLSFTFDDVLESSSLLSSSLSFAVSTGGSDGWFMFVVVLVAEYYSTTALHSLPWWWCLELLLVAPNPWLIFFSFRNAYLIKFIHKYFFTKIICIHHVKRSSPVQSSPVQSTNSVN